MDKEFLEKCLAEGMSLEQIAALTERHPSTVSYHLQKNGLVATGHANHAPNGRVDPERLGEIVDSGGTLREAAEEFGVGYSTIRYWVKKLGIETARSKHLRESVAARADGHTRVVLTCPRHGEVVFHRRPDGNYRCSKCRSSAVTQWRRRTKRRLVEMAGGRCLLCGYDKHPGALHFHHLDPGAKSFSLSRDGVTRSFAEAAAEAEKCALLCGNCHAEVEAGIASLPAPDSSDSSLELPDE